jgi:hypothetical protein
VFPFRRRGFSSFFAVGKLHGVSVTKVLFPIGPVGRLKGLAKGFGLMMFQVWIW